ncbi:MAG: hypothetical protein EOP48_26035, partial [Sphingobacteriales bacterium]
MKNLFLLILMHPLTLHTLPAQERSAGEREYRNTFRFNITNPFILSSKSLIFGYERIVNERQSFSINIGRAGFP